MAHTLTTSSYASISHFTSFFLPIKTLSQIACLLSLFVFLIDAQELERLTLTDGRVLVGIYDQPGARLEITTGTIKAWVPIQQQQIQKRELANPPSPPPGDQERRAIEDQATRERAQLAEQHVSEIAQRAKNETAEKQAKNEKIERDRLAQAQAATDALAEADRLRSDEMQRQIQARINTETANRHRVEVQKIEQQRLEQEKYDLAASADQARREADQQRIERADQQRQNEASEGRERTANRSVFFCYIVLGLVALTVSFFPTINAMMRRHRYRSQILLINVLACLSVIAIGGFLGVPIFALVAFPMWAGSLVWSTWPGLDEPRAHIEGSNRRPSRRHSEKTPESTDEKSTNGVA